MGSPPRTNRHRGNTAFLRVHSVYCLGGVALFWEEITDKIKGLLLGWWGIGMNSSWNWWLLTAGWVFVCSLLFISGLACLLAVLRQVFLYEKRWRDRPTILEALMRVGSWARTVRAGVLTDRMTGNNTRDFGSVPASLHDDMQIIDALLGGRNESIENHIRLFNASLGAFDMMSQFHRLRQDGIPQQDFILGVDTQLLNILNLCDRLRRFA